LTGVAVVVAVGALFVAEDLFEAAAVVVRAADEVEVSRNDVVEFPLLDLPTFSVWEGHGAVFVFCS
jgi:hypothetical protein